MGVDYTGRICVLFDAKMALEADPTFESETGMILLGGRLYRVWPCSAKGYPYKVKCRPVGRAYDEGQMCYGMFERPTLMSWLGNTSTLCRVGGVIACHALADCSWEGEEEAVEWPEDE